MKRVKTLLPVIIPVFMLALVAAIVIPTLFYHNHFLPGTQLTCPTNSATNHQTFDLSKQTLAEAQTNTAANFICQPPTEVALSLDGDKVATMPATNLGLVFDFNPVLQDLLAHQNLAHILSTLSPLTSSPPLIPNPPQVTYDQDSLEKFVAITSAGLYQPVTPPSFQLLPDQEIEIEIGIDGQTVVDTSTIQLFATNLAALQFNSPLVVETLPWKWSDVQLATMAATLDYPAIEPILKIQDGQVTEFAAPNDGQRFDTVTFLSSATQSGTLKLPTIALPPQQSLADTNNLGIKEVIGFGESWYAGSIPGRIHNVSLTAGRINNYLLAPGEEFSFNKALGPVSAATGFKPGYIIQGGRSVLADGGGVCQVSSTVFRALLDAGVKITRRLPHSYRVSYYEIGNQPGFDATVYAGGVDLRFVNDTPGHILISTQTDSKRLYMSVTLYGTSDGRYSEILDYKQWDAKGAPATEYIEDLSLAPGTRQQIDWPAGGVKTQFRNVVYRANGEVLYDDTYYSNYQPWSAKFLVGPNP